MIRVTGLDGTSEVIANPIGLRITQEVSGDKTLAFSVVRNNTEPNAYKTTQYLSRVEVLGDTYVIMNVKETGEGRTLGKTVGAVHEFFYKTHFEHVYAKLNGSRTLATTLNFALANTGYTVNIIDDFGSKTLVDFGANNANALFHEGRALFDAEFTLSGTAVNLRRKVGINSDAQFRFGHNVTELAQDYIVSNLFTVIRGYGGEPDDNGVYPIVVDYRSPNADIYGENVADPIYAKDITTSAAMLAHLADVITDEPEVSLSLNFIDLRAAGYTQARPGIGDFVFVVYEPMGVTVEARIVAINTLYDANLRPVDDTITLSNIKRRVSDESMRSSSTSKTLKRILNGDQKLPLTALDEAVRMATQALQSAQTELVFDNGIIAVEKDDPNKLVLFNSVGLGISNDGGATFKTAITGEGIVADVITAGTLRGVLIEGVEIRGSIIESALSPTVYTRIQGASVENRGQWNRTWRGATEMHDVTTKLYNGILRFENPAKERALSIWDNGLGTFADGDGGGTASGVIEFFSHRFSDVNGLTVYSSGTFGVDVAEIVLQSRFSQTIESNESQIYFRPNRTNRPGNNTFALSVLNETAAHLTDGFLAYGSTANGYASGLRFSKRAAEPTAWLVDGNLARYGNTKFGAGYFMGYMAMSHTGENFYNGSTSEIRNVRATDYQNGIITYIDSRAANFHNASSLGYKTDFKEPELSGLYVINKLKFQDYILKSDLDEGNFGSRQIGVVSELSPEIATTDGLAVNMYKGWSYTGMAVQELDAKVRLNSDDITGLYTVVEVLISDYAELSNRLARLEALETKEATE